MLYTANYNAFVFVRTTDDSREVLVLSLSFSTTRRPIPQPAQRRPGQTMFKGWVLLSQTIISVNFYIIFYCILCYFILFSAAVHCCKRCYTNVILWLCVTVSPRLNSFNNPLTYFDNPSPNYFGVKSPKFCLDCRPVAGVQQRSNIFEIKNKPGERRWLAFAIPKFDVARCLHLCENTTISPQENGPGKFAKSSIIQPCICLMVLKFDMLEKHGSPEAAELWKFTSGYIIFTGVVKK